MTPVLAKRLGTDRSFERLYQKYAGDVYRYALVVLRNQADAEDVTQTTFMNAFRAMENGERPRSPQNWLIAIAHNVCRQRFRQSQRRPSEVAYEEELAEAVVDEDVISAEDIRRALGHIAFNQRAALVMRELEGRSYQEIAEILGTTVSAVETLIFRARRALREQLEEGITCHEAELAISKQLDGRLSRKEKATLRGHLRECADCAGFARSQRAQRGAIKSLSLIPLPQSLSGLFGSGGAAVGSGLAVKAAAVAAGAALATGAGYEGVHHGIIPTGGSGKATAAKAEHASRAPKKTAAARHAAAAVAPAQKARHGQNRFSHASAKAHPKRVGRGATAKPHRPTKPAHHKARRVARGHTVVKPTKPARPTKPAKPTRTVKPTRTQTNRGHHTGTTKPKKPKPTPPNTKRSGGGKPKAPRGQQGDATASSGHGKSAR
jgi:RNA polymerase sigma factor (sigma-70 family)